MNVQQRLLKLEASTQGTKLAVIWLNPGETQEDALRRVQAWSNQRVIFVTWQL